MAPGISEHLQEVNWTFAVQDIFHPRSHDNQPMVVLAGNVLSGGQEDPIGRSVRVFVGGLEVGRGSIVSRFRFDRALSEKSAYVYDGTAINRDDIGKEIVLVLCK